MSQIYYLNPGFYVMDNNEKLEVYVNDRQLLIARIMQWW